MQRRRRGCSEEQEGRHDNHINAGPWRSLDQAKMTFSDKWRIWLGKKEAPHIRWHWNANGAVHLKITVRLLRRDALLFLEMQTNNAGQWVGIADSCGETSGGGWSDTLKHFSKGKKGKEETLQNRWINRSGRWTGFPFSTDTWENPE